jgi:hypothetical protein
MALMACRLMMGSGVLRLGTQEIRRGQGGLPLSATRPMPELLESLFDMSFGPELRPNQQKIPDRSTSKIHAQTSSQFATPRGSLKAFFSRLGKYRPSGHAPKHESVQEQKQLEARVQALESLLKAERALCRAQREELARLRTEVNQIDALEADLAIERESGKQLVQWLEEAEQELAEVRRFFSSLAKDA